MILLGLANETSFNFPAVLFFLLLSFSSHRYLLFFVCGYGGNVMCEVCFSQRATSVCSSCLYDVWMNLSVQESALHHNKRHQFTVVLSFSLATLAHNLMSQQRKDAMVTLWLSSAVEIILHSVKTVAAGRLVGLLPVTEAHHWVVKKLLIPHLCNLWRRSVEESS